MWRYSESEAALISMLHRGLCQAAIQIVPNLREGRDALVYLRRIHVERWDLKRKQGPWVRVRE